VPRQITILEDKADRLEAMVEVLRELFPGVTVHSVDSVYDLSGILHAGIEDCKLICLDHDLGPTRMINGAIADPGDGRDAARLLAQFAPCCPVIVHSTNSAGALSMRETLRSAGWRVEQVVPYGDLEWIEQTWRPVVMKVVSSA
jgi:hypothetical protein